MRLAREIAVMMRPHQWVKNLFIFPALIFAKKLFVPSYLQKSLAAFCIFCALAGSVYILNDIFDLSEDRRHPEKKKRPLASGRVTKGQAWAAHAVLAALSLSLAFLLDVGFGAIAVFYYLMNVSYTLQLKRVVILDVIIVSFGFVVRAAAGGLAINVPVSEWLLICTTLLALFLVLAKRRHELLVLDERASQLMELSLAADDIERASRFRKSLEEYNPYFLDQMIAVTTATTLMAYILYTLSEDAIMQFGGPGLIYTVPFVIYGIFRYLYLIHMKREGGSPTRTLMGDGPLMADIILWGIAVVFVLYS